MGDQDNRYVKLPKIRITIVVIVCMATICEALDQVLSIHCSFLFSNICVRQVPFCLLHLRKLKFREVQVACPKEHGLK